MFSMANNSDTASDARSSMTKVAKLTVRVAALEESTYTLTLDNYRLKVKRRRLKKSFNRLAGRFLRLKEKYIAVVVERDRLAEEEFLVSAGFFSLLFFFAFCSLWASKPHHMYLSFCK